MKSFLILLILWISILLYSPNLLNQEVKAARITCGDYNVTQECGAPVFGSGGGQVGSCQYDDATYKCRNEATGQDIFCYVRFPLDCGTGVTVCGGPTVNDGYNCSQWCSDTYRPLCTDSERLKVGFEDPFHKTSNCVGCGHPGYPDCPGYTNPFYAGCGNNNNTQACKNLYPDTRIACSDFTQEVCMQEVTSRCVGSGECNNASGCNSATSTCTNNPCPSGNGVQCDQSHSCVFPVIQGSPTSTPTPTPIPTATPAPGVTPTPSPSYTPTGTCYLSGTVSGRNATAILSSNPITPIKLGRDGINWSVDSQSLGSNSGPSATATNLAPCPGGTNCHTFKAEVFCNAGVCNYPTKTCTSWSFPVLPGPSASLPPTGVCLVCDSGRYRTTLPGNCSSSSPACNAGSPNQGACRGTGTVRVGTSCGNTCVGTSCDPPITDAWITTLARFKLPDGRDYNGEGIPSNGWVPIYLGAVQNDTCWNSTWEDADTVPPGYVRAQNWSLYGIDGDYLAANWDYHRRGWKTFQWEIKGSYFGPGWTQTGTHSVAANFSQFLYPAFPDGFTVTRDAGEFQRNVCSDQSGSTKGTYCISLNTLQGDLSSKGSQCSGGYFQTVNFTVTPPSAGVFTINQPVSRCIGANPYIDLSWGASSTALSYDIYRSTDGGVTYSWIGQQSELNRALPDVNVTSGSTYYYKVIASNGYSTRESNVVSVVAASCDTTPPDITFTFPTTACLDYTNWLGLQNMSATVTDAGSGVGSVKFVISPIPAGRTNGDYIAADLTNDIWGTTIPFPGVGSFHIKVVAFDVAGNTSQSTSYPFQTETHCIGPWIQTTGGDVHSNTLIDAGRRL